MTPNPRMHADLASGLRPLASAGDVQRYAALDTTRDSPAMAVIGQ